MKARVQQQWNRFSAGCEGLVYQCYVLVVMHNVRSHDDLHCQRQGKSCILTYAIAFAAGLIWYTEGLTFQA